MSRPLDRRTARIVLTVAYLAPAVGLMGIGLFFVLAASGFFAGLVILIGLGLAFAGSLFLAAYFARSRAGIVTTRCLVLVAGLVVLYYHSRTPWPWVLIEWTAAGVLVASLAWFGGRGWRPAGLGLVMLALVTYTASWASGNWDKPDSLEFLYLFGYPGLLWLYAAFLGPWFNEHPARNPTGPKVAPGEAGFDP